MYEHMFVSITCEAETSEQQAHQTPWDHVDVQTVIPDGWSTSQVEDGLRVLERIRRQVESASATLVGSLPESRDALTALVRVTGTSASEARRRRLIAAVVGQSPVAAGLLAAGLLSGEHLAALGPIREHAEDLDVVAIAAVGKLPEDVRDEVEQVRLSHLSGADASTRQRALRRLVIAAGPEGMVAIRGLLPPIEGAFFESLLRSAMDANWRADHPERARIIGGHGGDSRDQRRLDALLQLLGIAKSPNGTRPTGASEHSPASDAPVASDLSSAADASVAADGANTPTAHPAPAVPFIQAKPTVVIVFDIDRYEAEILGHGPIPITTNLFAATKADLYYFFQSGRGEILKFGRAKRYPTAAQRLAVEVRDRHCIYPQCREPASRCQVHHLNEWLNDHGYTNVEVLGLFCDPHHRHLHIKELTADLQPGGTVTIRIRTTGEIIAIATPIR